MKVTRRAVTAGFLGGLAGMASRQAHPQSGATVQWPSFMWGEATNAAVLNELKQKFEAENPGVRVAGSTVPIAAFWDRQLTDLAAGRPVDVITAYDPEIRAFIDRGFFEPLDRYLQEAGIATEQLIPAARLAQDGGRTFAVPMQTNPRALFINRALYAGAGIEPPTDLTRMVTAVERLRVADRQQFGFALLARPGSANVGYIELMPVIAGFGGAFFRQGRPTANAPETIAALGFVKDLYERNLIPRGTDAATNRQLFAQGKVASLISGPFLAGLVADANQETFRSLDCVELPFPAHRTISVTVFLGVGRNSANKDWTARLLVRMLRDDIQGALVRRAAVVPGVAGKIPADYVSQNPWFRAIEAASRTAQSYAPEGAAQRGPEVIQNVGEAYEAMLFRGLSAEAAANELQQKLMTLVGAR